MSHMDALDLITILATELFSNYQKAMLALVVLLSDTLLENMSSAVNSIIKRSLAAHKPLLWAIFIPNTEAHI